MAEGLLRDRLGRRGVDARVSSTGLVTEDRAASEHGVAAMQRRGIDIAGHRSRRLTAHQVETADLVIGMERQHVREAAVLVPGGLAKSFTLPELARRIRINGERFPHETVADYLGRIGMDRRPTDLLGEDPNDEIADPYGRSAKHYERTAAEIEELVDFVVAHLVP